MRTDPSPSPNVDQLRHVRWIGEGSAAGKSTVARRLAGAYGLRVYSSDDTTADHALRTSPDTHPLLHAFLGMSMDERWLNRPPSEMLRTFHGFRGEAFELIVEDLLALPGNQVILAEGFRLLPRLVAPLLSGARHAVWLIPVRSSAARRFGRVVPSTTSRGKHRILSELWTTS